MLQHLVLAALGAGPANGYRVARRIGALPGAARVESGRIYSLLNELARRGALAVERAGDGSGRGRRLFRMTDEGRRELERWIERPVTAAEWLRRPMLAKLAIDDSFAAPSPRVLALDLDSRRRALARHAPRAGGNGFAALVAHRARRHLEIEIALLERCLLESELAVASAPSVSSRPKPVPAGSGSR